MTIIRNDERREAIWNYYKDYHDMTGRCPTMQECGDVIGASKAAVKHYILGFEREGKMKIVKRRVYLTNADGTIIEPRKSHIEKVSKQTSEAGKAGAEALKKRSLETGISRFNPGLAKDAAGIETRINRIVENAKNNGTYCHPRPKVVWLNGQKAG